MDALFCVDGASWLSSSSDDSSFLDRFRRTPRAFGGELDGTSYVSQVFFSVGGMTAVADCEDSGACVDTGTGVGAGLGVFGTALGAAGVGSSIGVSSVMA